MFSRSFVFAQTNERRKSSYSIQDITQVVGSCENILAGISSTDNSNKPVYISRTIHTDINESWKMETHTQNTHKDIPSIKKWRTAWRTL